MVAEQGFIFLFSRTENKEIEEYFFGMASKVNTFCYYNFQILSCLFFQRLY